MAITRQREAGAFDYWDKEELQTEVLGREIEENALIESWTLVLDALREAEAEAEMPKKKNKNKKKKKQILIGAGSNLQLRLPRRRLQGGRLFQLREVHDPGSGGKV